MNHTTIAQDIRGGQENLQQLAMTEPIPDPLRRSLWLVLLGNPDQMAGKNPDVYPQLSNANNTDQEVLRQIKADLARTECGERCD